MKALLYGLVFLFTVSAHAQDENQGWPWLDSGSYRVGDNKQTNKAYLRIQYLGTAGVLIGDQQHDLLTDPFFSNPPISDLLLFKDLQPNREIINHYLPNLVTVKGLLIGHGHYDHLMDVPGIAAKLPGNSKIYGSLTALNQIAGKVSVPTVNLLPYLDKPIPERWLYLSSAVRFMPIEAGHSTHIAGYTFAADQVLQPMKTPPGSALAWQCGQSLGYVMDWLNNDKVIFRALFLSSATGYPKGLPPRELLNDNIPFDLLLLPVAKYHTVADYPAGLLTTLKPRFILMIHWEKFWQPYEPGKEAAVSEAGVAGFIELIQRHAPEARYFLPRRLAILELPMRIEP